MQGPSAPQRCDDLAVTPPDVPSVDPRDVGDDVLLDVREQDEWDAGHAPGAVHVPLSEFVERLPEVPADRAVAVVCRSGHRSESATAFLVAQGRSARNVEGGMLTWAALGLPVEAAGGRPARIA